MPDPHLPKHAQGPTYIVILCQSVTYAPCAREQSYKSSVHAVGATCLQKLGTQFYYYAKESYMQMQIY